MQDPSLTPPSASRSWRPWLVFLTLVAAVAINWGLPKWRAYLETLGAWYVKAAPLAVREASGQLLLATIVAQERPNWNRPTRRGYANDYVVELQLNHPDASDAGRAFVHRTEASVLNVDPLGVDGDRVWIFAEGLRAVSVSERAPAIDPAGLEARLPELAGNLSSDVRHYDWRPDGVTLLTRDGRRLALDRARLTLAPAPERTPTPQAKTHDEWRRQMAEYDDAVARTYGTRYATLAGEYGLDSWRTGDRWIGLLTATERQGLSRSWARPSRPSYSPLQRRTIWLAEAVKPVERPMEYRAVELADVRPAGSKEYLGGAVLGDGGLRAVPIPETPDVLVEHYTAVDDSGQMQLTRVTPDGTERWSTTLPLQLPRTVTAAGDYVAFTGFTPGVSDDRKLQLVSVRLSDGAISTYAYNR